MKRFGEKAFLAGTVVALGAAIAWHLTHIVPAAHIVIGIDSSRSMRENCGGLSQAMRDVLEKASGLENESTISVVVMGTSETNPHARLAFSEPVPMPKDSVFQDGGEAIRKQQEIFERVADVCLNAEIAERSPIYQMVKDSLDHLRSLGCTGKGPCYLVVRTDLVEDVETAMRSALATPEVLTGDFYDLAESLVNPAIEVTFCGTAEVQSRSKKATGSPSEIAIQGYWLHVFSDPESVTFRPYCAGPNAEAVDQ